jgi:hypothetical protein
MADAETTDAFLLRMRELMQSGYAGYIGPREREIIVDRREYPGARPMQRNQALGVPVPKPLANQGLEKNG